MKVIALMTLLSAAAYGLDVPYQKPPKDILDVLLAPAPPTASVNPTHTHILLMERTLYPQIAELAAPMYRLAGLRINPRNNGPHISMASFYSATLKKVDDGSTIKLNVPAGARLGFAGWSPDGARFYMLNTTENSIDLYLGSAGSATLRKVQGVSLNNTTETPVRWLSGSNELLVLLTPPNRGAAPPPPAAPEGPNVQESSGKAAAVWTYQDLLKSPYDEKLFDYFATSQPAIVDAATGKVTPIGAPGVFNDLTPSPDGKHLLVSRIQKPYSYLHPYNDFPQDVEVWDRSGKLLQKVASLPLQDKVPVDGVPTGPRNFNWRPTEPASLVWWEALDGGDPKAKVPFRDKLMMQKAPFRAAPVEIVKTQHRAAGVLYGEKGGLALVSDYDREKRWRQTFRVFLDDPQAQPKLVWSLSVRDRYKDPGTPFLRVMPNGKSVMWQDGEWIYMRGTGATPQGDRPFLSRMNVNTFQSEELFRAGDKGFEQVVALLSDDGSRFLTSFETQDMPPNLYIRQRGSDTRKAITDFPDPTPQLRSIKRELVRYKRADGVDLSFTLYLPPDYKEGTRLPAVVWAYPLEYNDPYTAGQVTGSTQRYTFMRGSSILLLLLQGYAVLYDVTLPVVGDFETVNNTYVQQIVDGAKAAIDKADQMGVIDRNRVGVSGHSYGAFMTANLLAHSDLFRAGVARSGAYNRTLTPFGFQSERRTFWEARSTYMEMSPFAFANQIKEPILFIHGEMDNNPGTFPIQSERMYQAVRGNGGTTRLVLLPYESHGYMAQQSIEQTLWETLTWFDKYVKNAAPLSSSR